MTLYINIYRTRRNWARMKAGDLFVHERALPATLYDAAKEVMDNPEEYEYTIEEKEGVCTKINLLMEASV